MGDWCALKICGGGGGGGGGGGRDLEGQLAASHAIDVGGQLVRVAAVLEREVELVRACHHRRRLLVLRERERERAKERESRVRNREGMV